MGTADITVRPYDGTLASLNLGGLINQNVLNAIGSPTGGTIRDDDGVLDSGDSGTATFTLDGEATGSTLTYLGTGTISLIGVAGVRLFPRDISIFEADGQIYLYLPEGLPPLSRFTFRIDVNLNTPLTLPDFVPCFASGTRIVTRRGAVAVESIVPGDTVVATDGRQHKVLWVGSKTINLAELCDDHYRKLVPVRISAEAMGARPPHHDLVVSQQHRILLRHPLTDAVFGMDECLVPAVAMVGYMAEFATDITHVTYHHILCAEHVTLLANGIEAESLFMGDLLEEGMRPALRAEIDLVFPQMGDLARRGARQTCHPTLKTYEGRLLSNMIAGPAKCVPVPVRRAVTKPTLDEMRYSREAEPDARLVPRTPTAVRPVQGSQARPGAGYRLH